MQLALLDRRLANLLARYPEINAVIVDRLSVRAQRLAITQAISQLNRVDRRLLALFWHLAERWGKVSREGIAVPLVLSHRLIGELVGARRPTVSTALAELARDGQVVRRDDGTWLLTGEPVNVPRESVTEVIRQRRRLMPGAEPSHELDGEPEAGEHRLAERLLELRTSMAAATLSSQRQREALAALQSQTATLRERTVELRSEREARLSELRRAAARRRDPA